MKTLKALNLCGPLLAALVVASVSGCTMKMGLRNTNTKFVYPNSNVTPLGPVKAATEQRFTVFSAAMFDAKEIDETIAKALAQKGGDVLVNSKIVYKVTLIPIILPFMFSSYEVEGMAAKMVVGKQELQ
ncbi:MAG: hypothetical protein WC943_04890 [Elusimicrobiota bacterium]|jgi:hypothetical protein